MEDKSRYTNLFLNAALFAVNAFATKFVVFLLVPLYTYFMSSEEYGIADMSLTVISLVTPLATLSIADAAVRFIVGNRKNECEYVAIAFIVTCVSVPLVLFLTPALDLPFFGGLGGYKIEFVVAYAAGALLQFCSEAARGIGRIKLIPIFAAISSLLTCASAGILIGLCGYAIRGYYISVSVGPMVAAALYLTVGDLGKLVVVGVGSLAARGFASGFKPTAGAMLRYSLPLIPNSLFWWMGTSINRFFITGMIGIGASGLFAAAGKVPGLVNTVYAVFQQAWQLSAFQEARKEGVDAFFSQVFLVLQVVMLALCSILILFAPTVADLVLQGEFYNAWPFMTLLLLSNLLNVFNAFYGTVYTATLHTGYIMKTTALGAAACTVLTPLLIMPFGVAGACAASCCGNAIVLAMRAKDSRKYIKLDVGWRYLVPSLLMIVLQVLLTMLRVSFWRGLSGVLFVLILMTQAIRFMPSNFQMKRLH